MNPFQLAGHLVRMGHAPGVANASHAIELWSSSPNGFEDALARYQEWHLLPITGELDGTTREHLGRPRCAHPDLLADIAECQWPIKDLTWFQDIRYPGVDPARVERNYTEAVRRAIEGSTLTVNRVYDVSLARVVAIAGSIDGPANIVALTELPCGFTASSVSHQTFDIADATTLADDELMIACMCHEFLHALGLGHARPGSGALMEPVLNRLISRPQAWDIAQRDERYGALILPPTALPPLVAPAVPVPKPIDPFTFTMSFPQAGSYEFTVRPVPQPSPPAS